MSYRPPRIAPPPADAMTATQRRLYDNTVRVLGGPVGPRMVLLNHEPLAEAWAALGDVIKNAGYPVRLRELVVLMVARHWRADFEWYAHEKQARAAGLPDAVIDAVRRGVRPAFDDEADAAIHDYCDAIQRCHAVDDAVYDRALAVLGQTGIIGLTALIGQYTGVAITLVAHRIMLPDGQPSPFADAAA